MISAKEAKQHFTIDENSFETYLDYEYYKDGLFWMKDRVFFMIEITGGIYYYSSQHEILSYYQKLKTAISSIPDEANVVLQSFFMPFRDVEFDPPASKSSNPAVSGFYDETVSKMKNGPKNGYYDEKSLLREMKNYLIVVFPMQKQSLSTRIEDVLDQRSARTGSSFEETLQLWKRAFLTGLRGLNVKYSELNADAFLYMMFTLLNQDFDPIKLKYNPEIPLKRQVLYNILTTDHHEVAYTEKRWALGYVDELERVKLGFLLELVQLRRPFFVSVVLHKMSRVHALAVIKGRKASTFNKEKRYELEMLERQLPEHDVYQAEIYLGILIDDYKEVTELLSELKPFTAEYRWDFNFETAIAPDILRSALPAHYNEKAGRRLMLFDDYAMAFLNFRNFHQDFSKSGVMLASEALTPKMVNLFDSTSYGTLISGGSGSGKTMFSQYLIMSHLAEGHIVITIDPVGNFESLAATVSGQYTRIGLSESCDGLDCFPRVSYDELKANKELLAMSLTLVERMITLGSPEVSLSAKAKSVLQSAIEMMYKSTDSPDISVFVEVLESMESEAASLGKQSYAGEFAAALQLFTPDGLYGNLISSTPLEITNQFTAFDIMELRERKELAQLAIYGLMTKISSLIMEKAATGKKCVLIIDEAHYLITDRSSAEFIKNGVRVWRTYGSALALISQQLTDLLENKEIGEGIFKTVSNFFVFAQSPESIKGAQQYIGYNDAEAQAMCGLKTLTGQYSFLAYYTRSIARTGEPAFSRFYLAIPRYFYWLMTSLPDDKTRRQQKVNKYIEQGLTSAEAIHQSVLDILDEEQLLLEPPT